MVPFKNVSWPDLARASGTDFIVKLSHISSLGSRQSDKIAIHCCLLFCIRYLQIWLNYGFAFVASYTNLNACFSVINGICMWAGHYLLLKIMSQNTG